mmetsp:Transcript_37293/g.73928  ORF Transcript_37293/g.73928 Transcript_37293/m.73928 type:complete len:98 (+) Transcript_37293:799-1092(+)
MLWTIQGSHQKCSVFILSAFRPASAAEHASAMWAWRPRALHAARPTEGMPTLLTVTVITIPDVATPYLTIARYAVRDNRRICVSWRLNCSCRRSSRS